MGVSLERVQLKFAAIIGELCTEPDVLSQFAVWLDLRLAEYKLKGALSLVCSGQDPDPLWLKGLYKMKQKHAALQADKRTVSNTNSPSHTYSQPCPRRAPHVISSVSSATQRSPRNVSANFSQERLSPDVPMFVKEEPSDDIFPISFPIHNSRSFESTDRRKRLLTDSGYSNDWSEKGGSDDDHDFHITPPKQRRVESSEQSPANQSLMSVIGGFQEDIHAEQDKDSVDAFVTSQSVSVDDSEVHLQRSNSNASEDILYTSAQSEDTSLSCHARLQSDVMDSSGEPSTSADYHDLSPTRDSKLCPVDGSPFGTGSRRFALERQESSKKSITEENIKRRERLRNYGEMPIATMRNIVGAVASFERWLWTGPFDDKRSMHEIPPEELDAYLVNFFQTATTPVGGEYKLKAMQSLRSNLDKYLESTNYPQSISRSPVFAKSQLAYKSWIAARK